MPAALYDADNVMVGEAHLYFTPWVKGEVVPPIDDDVALFDPDSWVNDGWETAGATHEGFKVNVNTSTTTITIEEQSTPVSERIESKGLTIEAALAEDTLKSIQLSWGGDTIDNTAAGVGQVGVSKMALTDDIQYWTVCLEMRNIYGLARRIYIPKASITGSGETSFRRAADKRTYPMRVTSICKPSDIQIIDITAAAESGGGGGGGDGE